MKGEPRLHGSRVFFNIASPVFSRVAECNRPCHGLIPSNIALLGAASTHQDPLLYCCTYLDYYNGTEMNA